MAQIQIIGNAVVVTSLLSVAQIEKLELFKPETLKLVEKDVEIFGVTFDNKKGTGHFSKWGIVFTGENGEGLAQTTLLIPNMPNAEKVEYVQNHFGYGLLALNKIETIIMEAYANLVIEFNTMSRSITLFKNFN